MKTTAPRPLVLFAILASTGVIAWHQQTAKQPVIATAKVSRVPSARPPSSSAEVEAPHEGESSETGVVQEPSSTIAAATASISWKELELQLQEESLPERRGELMKQLPAAAVADGPRAMALLLSCKDEPLRRSLFAPMLDAWADAQPSEALHWYHDAAQDELAALEYHPSPSFYGKSFRAEAQRDIPTAAQSFSAISQDEDRLAALASMLNLARETQQLPRTVENLGTHGELKLSEIALISATVGDSSGYTAATALLTPEELKRLQAYLPPAEK